MVRCASLDNGRPGKIHDCNIDKKREPLSSPVNAVHRPQNHATVNGMRLHSPCVTHTCTHNHDIRADCDFEDGTPRQLKGTRRQLLNSDTMPRRRVYTVEEYKSLPKVDKLCAALSLIEEVGVQDEEIDKRKLTNSKACTGHTSRFCSSGRTCSCYISTWASHTAMPS